MAKLTLGQLLDLALGTPKTEPINFEQLRNLLNGMLVNLGLRDLTVQDSGEPLEGTSKIPSPASIAADIEELKQRTEANEREIAEVRALCEELRVEINEVKEQQSHMAETIQKMQEPPDTVNFEDELDNLDIGQHVGQTLDTVMPSQSSEEHEEDMMGQEIEVPPEWPQEPGMRKTPWEDQGLIVIGNEISLVDRSRTSSPRQRDARASSPVLSKSRAGAQSRGKDLPPGVMSSPQVSFMASDMGRNSMGPIKDEKIQMDISKGAALPSPKAWSRGKKLLHRVTSSPRVSFVESDVGWDGMEHSGDDEDIKTRISKSGALPSLLGAPHEINYMEQIKDEETKMRISKAESLPSPLHMPPEMNDMEQIKDEEIEMSFSKAPPHIQSKSLDALRVHPGSPGIHTPIQPMKPVRGHPASQALWIPAESVAGADSGSRSRTAKEAQGRGSFRMEPSQMEPRMKLLRLSSPEYLPRDQPFTMQFPGPPSPPGSPALPMLSPPGSPARSRRSDIVSFTPPPSPGLTGRLPHIVKQYQEHGQREQAEGYSRRSPMYCGGRHTSICPVQPMEPLLPDPSKPGVFDLVGRDGIVYRGRQCRDPMGSWMEQPSYSNLQ